MDLPKLRSINPGIWANEEFARLSPEQKLILLYLNTTEFLEPDMTCVIRFKMMAFQLGLDAYAFKNALGGLLSAAPSFIGINPDDDPLRIKLLTPLFHK